MAVTSWPRAWDNARMSRWIAAGLSVSTVEVPCDEDGWECRGPGPWRHYVTVDRIDCVRLELRLATESVRDRPGRYRPILAHLRDHGADHGADRELLQQCMAVRGVPEELVDTVRGRPR